jgi:uncharacterized protein (DUF433 family)
MTILEKLVALPPPLKMGEGGVIRMAGTRVRLDTVVTAFQHGCSAEEILLKYPSLNLTDIYAAITYYLWHREEVDAYLEERRLIAAQVREENEKRFPPGGVRERLLARRSST